MNAYLLHLLLVVFELVKLHLCRELLSFQSRTPVCTMPTNYLAMHGFYVNYHSARAACRKSCMHFLTDWNPPPFNTVESLVDFEKLCSSFPLKFYSVYLRQATCFYKLNYMKLELMLMDYIKLLIKIILISCLVCF